MSAEGEAPLFLACPATGAGTRNTSTFALSWPLAASTESARSERLSSIAVVSQISLPATTGEDQPLPGSAAFQRTFVCSFHVTGSPDSWEVPSPPGPRNWGQSSAKARNGTSNTSKGPRTPVLSPGNKTGDDRLSVHQ